MKIRNISAKIIGVNGTPIIPDCEIEVTKAEVSVPSVQRLIDDGMLMLVGEWGKEENKKKAGAAVEVQAEKDESEAGNEKDVAQTETVEKTATAKRGPRAKK